MANDKQEVAELDDLRKRARKVAVAVYACVGGTNLHWAGDKATDIIFRELLRVKRGRA